MLRTCDIHGSINETGRTPTFEKAKRKRPDMVLKLRLAAALYRFKESLALLPTLIMLAAAALGGAAIGADSRLGYNADVPLTLAMNSNGATWFLATTAGAMMTTAGVVFSLTVVSLQLASDQFSPRVMRSFIRDRVSQVVIGLLVGTFVYCLLVLGILSAEPADPAPPISLTVAALLTLATVIGIIVHLDRLSRGLQVGNLARNIAREGRSVMTRLENAPPSLIQVEPNQHPIPKNVGVIRCQRDGWVSQVDRAQILKSVPANATVRLETRVGAYIHEDEVLFSIWPPSAVGPKSKLASAVEIAPARTMIQDVDFAIRQLVDIGLRALSPAINDPTTAVEVILRLGSLMRTVLSTPPEPDALQDKKGRVLLLPWNLSKAEYVDHAFDQLRQTCVDQPHVVACLLRVLRMLIQHVDTSGHSEHASALEKHLRLLSETVQEQEGFHYEDLKRLELVANDNTDPADHSR